MSEFIPPQRRGAAGPGTRGNPRSQPGQAGAGGRGLSPAQGAEEAEKRLRLPCYHVGQKVAGMFGCVACQFQIRNRSVLPACPQCGELVWAFLEDGPRPVPEGEAPIERTIEAAPSVEEGVSIEPTSGPVKVEDGVPFDL